ncbi:MAG: hypothetical protein ACLQRH_24625, partial [Acidimicrobiales bacterium]
WILLLAFANSATRSHPPETTLGPARADARIRRVRDVQDESRVTIPSSWINGTRGCRVGHATCRAGAANRR